MDDLDELLAPGPVPSALPHQRAEVWRRMAVVQRRRQWLRYARTAVLLAICYAAGAATLWWWHDPLVPPPGDVQSPEPVKPAPPAVESPSPPPDAEADPYRGDPPHIIERWAAMAEGRRRVDLYRRAGDLYYERFGDAGAAIRCYRRALDGGTPADLVVQADKDNWLLMSLKVARLKEKRDERN